MGVLIAQVVSQGKHVEVKEKPGGKGPLQRPASSTLRRARSFFSR